MPKILCIEDEIELRQEIVEELQDAGYQTVEADDGVAGLAAIKKQKPDLVLCDISMPRMNGQELLNELRGNYPQFADLPFVFLTALADRSDVLAGIELGADDYLTKPIDFEMMLARVGMSLRQVVRINEKKNVEQVKLYKALTQNAGNTKETPRAPPQQPAARISTERSPALEDSLRRILERVDAGSAGKLHFINLAEMKDELGSEWSNVAEKAMAIAEQVIKKNLGSTDLYDRSGEHAFFLIFPGLSQQQAHFKSETIANEICNEMLNNNAGKYRNLSLATTSLDLRDLAKSTQPIGIDALASAFDEQSMNSDQCVSSSTGFISRFLSQLSLRYQPLWNAENEVLVAYRSVPSRTTHYGVFSGDEVLHGGVHDPIAKDLDAFIVAEVKRLLRRMKDVSTTVPVVIPLHVSTLLGSNAQGLVGSFADICKGSPVDAMMVELRGFEDFSTNPNVWRAMRFLRSALGPIIIECSPNRRFAATLISHGVSFLATGYDASMDPAAELERLGDFAKGTRALGLQPFVYGLNSVGAIKLAMRAGVRVLSGKAISPDIDAPQCSKRLARQTVLG